ncbi:Di-trans-poly-cis-decaprenylcistransferase-like protein [Artemisia annua]|uniref:Di-trans-poly-cis-decaprenylcistransferase-like protein n=1 Tax=Artemisia annua TaxID=35608 RepID=A0A2U1NAC2_ARTAN|nr:Di-trans-poly-cis-decaprenylcistransferase-like protein [Artemisia annua]
MAVSAHNTETYLLICAAYFSSHEIQSAVSYACNGKSGGVQAFANPGLLMKELSINGNGNVIHGDEEVIKVMDLEKHMYMRVVPNSEILVRSPER